MFAQDHFSKMHARLASRMYGRFPAIARAWHDATMKGRAMTIPLPLVLPEAGDRAAITRRVDSRRPLPPK